MIAKTIDKKINKDGKNADDASKLREDLMERLKHMELRVDQMSATHLTLSNENAEIKAKNAEISAKVEFYDEDRKTLKVELRDTKIELEKALRDINNLKNDLTLKDTLHSEERHTWEKRVKELEEEVDFLENSLKLEREK